VPLGPRELLGVVWARGRAMSRPEMKPVAGPLRCPADAGDHRRFIDWVAAYTCRARAVMRMSLTAPKALEPARPGVAFRRGALSAD